MEGGDRLGGEFVEGGGGLDGFAGGVHVGLRFEGEDACGADLAFGYQAAEARFPGGEAVAGGDGVERHEADVVALMGGRGIRVPEADP